MTIFTEQELKDLFSAIINDTQGTWGDARSLRLEDLILKVGKLVKEENN